MRYNHPAMRRATFISITLLLLSGCSFGKLSAIEYNNKIVAVLNEISDSIESSVEHYDEAIPATVNEKSEIDAGSLQKALSEMQTETSDLEGLKNMQSKSTEQESEVKSALEGYIQAHSAYLQAYEGTVNYYQNKGYQEDVEQVKVVDETLHKTYNDLVEAHNHLVEILSSYIQ